MVVPTLPQSIVDHIVAYAGPLALVCNTRRVAATRIQRAWRRRPTWTVGALVSYRIPSTRDGWRQGRLRKFCDVWCVQDGNHMIFVHKRRDVTIYLL